MIMHDNVTIPNPLPPKPYQFKFPSIIQDSTSLWWYKTSAHAYWQYPSKLKKCTCLNEETSILKALTNVDG